jgi:hypothetical protein
MLQHLKQMLLLAKQMLLHLLLLLLLVLLLLHLLTMLLPHGTLLQTMQVIGTQLMVGGIMLVLDM